MKNVALLALVWLLSVGLSLSLDVAGGHADVAHIVASVIAPSLGIVTGFMVGKAFPARRR